MRGLAGDGPQALGRLRVLGILVPVAFVIVVEFLRVVAVGRDRLAITGHVAFAAVMTLSIVAFTLAMFAVIDRAQLLLERHNRELAVTNAVATAVPGEQAVVLVADLQRRRREGHAGYDVLLQISSQRPLQDVLGAVVRAACDLLACDEASLCLDQVASPFIQLDEALTRAVGVGASLTVPIHGSAGSLGDLRVGRQRDVPFTERDRTFLMTLAKLVAITITNAELRENDRQRAILSERERIARELHDNLAQVLGATHVRLRALGSRLAVRGKGGSGPEPTALAELTELADLCQESYGDVREAILGLHESSRADRGLLDSLSAYLDRYSRLCGIETSLECTLDHELALSPSCEVQLIRVIQEALTNVRKHSDARSAVVRITEARSAITFLVEDDGHGFELDHLAARRDGFGLHSMRERMTLLSGDLVVDSAPGRGTRVVASVPLPRRPTHAPAGITDIAEAVRT
ncbi:MAG: GAF domain-containing sensor histidine kinase [Actinobacteria bacterium]|nr:GAF domain-containing sensor histidine kinase [Actinomycetota bacterium]